MKNHDMDGVKDRKGAGSAGRSPSKNNTGNRPGAIIPAKSATTVPFNLTGPFA